VSTPGPDIVFNAGSWFIRSDDGQPHMTGWGLTRRFDGLAICPRCRALVFQDDDPIWRGNQTAHERWHADTDHPIPSDLIHHFMKPQP
jgi:hypothetical protein